MGLELGLELGIEESEIESKMTIRSPSRDVGVSASMFSTRWGAKSFARIEADRRRPGRFLREYARNSPSYRKKSIAPGLGSGALLENRIAVEVAAATVGLEIIDEFKAGGGDELIKLRIVAVVAIAWRTGAGSKREQEVSGL